MKSGSSRDKTAVKRVTSLQSPSFSTLSHLTSLQFGKRCLEIMTKGHPSFDAHALFTAIATFGHTYDLWGKRLDMVSTRFPRDTTISLTLAL